MSAPRNIGLFLTLLAALAAARTVSAEADSPDTLTVYRGVGPDGVVTFSDRASKGAQAIEVPVSSPRPEEIARAGETLRQTLDVIDVLERSRHADAAEAAERRRLDIEYARIDAARIAAEAAMNDDYDDHSHYFYAPWYGAGYPRVHPHPGFPGTCRPGFGACYDTGFHPGVGMHHPGGDQPMPRAPRSMQVKLL